MCPLRIILLFLSATLAGYFAWTTIRSSSNIIVDVDDDVVSYDSTTTAPPKKKHQYSFTKIVQDGFYVFVDMASGKYLWRNLRVINGNDEQEKDC
ncbi:Methyltransferase-related protein [Thalictrum thalictroides]|uniref:Methyltransferase-related protein n=1 Tax=Thalictrum thalictroides TaxID=46969 RepID=A0A7J6X2G2_THATH|nr:Methyltransferase-related protein [Thalictrum thalictroides]